MEQEQEKEKEKEKYNFQTFSRKRKKRKPMDLSLKNTSTEQEKEKETEIWLSEFVKTDKEEREEVLRMAKEGVADLGRYSCLILTSVVTPLLEDSEIWEIFRHFRACLEQRIEPHHSLVVMDRIFAFIESAEKVLRLPQNPNPYVMDLKGEALVEDYQSWVFTSAEKSNAWSLLDRLCDQIIFMENMVEQVMSQTVGVETMGAYIQWHENCMKSMDWVISSRLNYISSLSDEDGSDCEILESVMVDKTREIWSNFELYQQPFTSLS